MHPQTRPSGFFMGSALGSCVRCGRTKFTSELAKEWTGNRVCADCHDPRPPQLDPPAVVNEGLPVPDAAPFLGVSFIDTNNPVTPESL